jgi:hypothetical protein
VQGPTRAQLAERCLVLLVTLHTIGVGTMLLLTPVWSCRVFGGWTTLGPLFFPRQSGIFHFALAFAYLHEYFRHRSVTVLVVTKGLALLFLLSGAVLDTVPWVVPFSGIADGMMGAAVLLLHRQAQKAGVRQHAV